MGDSVADFEERRGRMFGLAYRMLGSAQDAEDVVQDAFLRRNAVAPGTVEHPTAWLDKVVTNLCLNRLTSARSRQLLHRANEHLDQPRARFTADHEQHRRLLEGFLRAAREGDVDGLKRLLAADVVSYADGGGIVSAARRPVFGPNRVARYVCQGLARVAGGMVVDVAEVNGATAVVARVGATTAGVLLLDVRGDRIAALHIVANPEKLTFLDRQLADLSRPGSSSGSHLATEGDT